MQGSQAYLEIESWLSFSNPTLDRNEGSQAYWGKSKNTDQISHLGKVLVSQTQPYL